MTDWSNYDRDMERRYAPENFDDYREFGVSDSNNECQVADSYKLRKLSKQMLDDLAPHFEVGE
jgi:hypothetical protein